MENLEKNLYLKMELSLTTEGLLGLMESLILCESYWRYETISAQFKIDLSKADNLEVTRKLHKWLTTRLERIEKAGLHHNVVLKRMEGLQNGYLGHIDICRDHEN